MVFSSVVFLYYFLPLTVLLYFAVPNKAKNTVLLLASLLFYAWGEPVYIALMLFSMTMDYTFGRVIAGQMQVGKSRLAKRTLVLAAVLNIGLLVFFKYADFVINNINTLLGLEVEPLNLPLPIGISFYTFHAMSYVIDIYRQKIKVQKNIVSFGMYIALFPALVAGPIIRYTTIQDEVDNRKHSLSLIADGIGRFSVGLAKKVLIANPLGQMADNIFVQQIGDISPVTAWIGIIAYTLQIYFDFSGYSDMAIGLAKVFGFKLDENFNYPYISKSVTEFWRRWHISLSSWFRDYVYISMGGNRVAPWKVTRNILVVWMLTGLWHGAAWNFVFWGLYYGVIIIAEKHLRGKFPKVPTIVARAYTIFAFMIGWVFFRATDLTHALAYIQKMFSFASGNLMDAKSWLYLHDHWQVMLVAIIGSTPLLKNLYCKIKGDKPIEDKPMGFALAMSFGICAVLFVCTICLTNSTYNPFIYFRF